MDEVVRADAMDDRFSGAVLVARDGDLLLDKGYGLANREWDRENDGQTKFRIGSLSKQFTAAAVLLLQERGQLDLDAPVKSWLPNAPAGWDAVTVRHLLSHTSGIPDFTRAEDYERLKTLPTTTEALLSRFRERPLEFQPGEGFAYSNSGYVVLTAVIEAVSGQSYADFLAANIFAPLGMGDSGYDRADVVLPKRAAGYGLTRDGIVNADVVDMSVPAGAGGLYSTTRDLLKWEQGLFGGRLLNARSLALMTEPVRQSYALGLAVSEVEGRRTIWHNGAIDGFRSYMAYDPGDRTTVIVLANVEGDSATKVGMDLLTLARGGSVTLAAERQALQLTEDALADYVGVYDLAPGFALTVSVTKGSLWVQATGQQPAELTAERPDAFFLTVVDAQITFARNAAGVVESLVLHQGGRDMPARRR